MVSARSPRQGSACVGDAGGAVSNHAGWPASDGYYNVTQEAETGTRTLWGALSVAGLGCWDWTTMAVCEGGGYSGGWISSDVDGGILPSAYGATFDGTCAVGLGDPGQVFTVDPSGASPCTSLGSGTAGRSIDLRDQRCDGTVGDAAWRDIRVLEREPG